MSSLDLDRPSLTDMAYQEIRNRILIGGLQPGDKLVVNDLVETLHISNTPIKEALNRLVSEGLVETVPRRGMRVRLFTAKELREFFEIRALYETHCCRVAAQKIDAHPQILEEMTTTLEKSLDILTDENNYLLQFQLDELFHMLIVGLCGNDMLIKTFDRLHANILTIGIYASRKQPLRRQDETYREHRNILDALLRRSGDDMAEAMRVHLDNTASALLRMYHPTSGRFMSR